MNDHQVVAGAQLLVVLRQLERHLVARVLDTGLPRRLEVRVLDLLLHLAALLRLSVEQRREERDVVVGVVEGARHLFERRDGGGAAEVLQVPLRHRLPQLLQRHDLRPGNVAQVAEAALAALRVDVAVALGDPREQRAVLDERLPEAGVPVEVGERVAVHARLAAQQDHDTLRLGWHEPEQEEVLRAAHVALERRVAEGSVLVQARRVVLRAHQVGDDVRGAAVPRAVVAEPLLAVVAAHGAEGVRRVAVRARVLRALRELLEVGSVEVVVATEGGLARDVGVRNGRARVIELLVAPLRVRRRRRRRVRQHVGHHSYAAGWFLYR
mmetsp:Transcript_23462/g.72696  ORF Transcript_23462/g.72696 Transcript_23462/m.72696 type:complete len:325 (-) Transcript_23462:35-1009(-)